MKKGRLEKLDEKPRYTLGEEIGNAVTHGAGIALSIIGLVIILIKAVNVGGTARIVSSAIFGSSMIILYSASTLYHSFPPSKTKRIFRILDHSAIYVLIAGTYTPFCLVLLDGWLGIAFLAVVWFLALVGTVVKAFMVGRYQVLSTVMYIAMGWLVMFAIKPLYDALETMGFIFLIMGGIFYTGGAIFLAWRKFPHYHMIFHLFVIAGTLSHYFCILLYVI